MITKNIKLLHIYLLLVAFIFAPTPSYAESKSPTANTLQNTINYKKEIKDVKKNIYNKKYFKALGYLKVLLEYVDPVDKEMKYELLTLIADSYRNVQMYDRSIKNFKLATILNKDPKEAFSGLIKVSFLDGRFNDAINYYKSYKKVNDGKLGFESYYLLMLANYKSGNFKGALKISKLIRRGAGVHLKPYIYYIKAQSLLKLSLKNNKDAKKLLKIIINDKYADKGFKAKVRLTFANLLFEEGQYKKALKQYLSVNHSIFLDQSKYGEIWCYIKQKNYKDALKATEVFLLSFKESSLYEDVIMLKGQIFAIDGKYKSAVVAFEEAKEDFDYAKKFMLKSMLDKDYIKRVSSLIEVVDFPPYRYSNDFRYFKLKSNTAKRYNEKRLLKSLAKKNYVYNDLSSLIGVRYIMESLNESKIDFRSLESKYEFNIEHFEKMVVVFNNEIEKLKAIKLTHIKTELKKETAEMDINAFATANDKYLLKTADDSLFDVEKVLQYIDTIKNLFAKKLKKNRFFKNLQKAMLESPAFSLSYKKELNVSLNLNNDEKKLLNNIISLKDDMYALNNQFNLILWDVSSKMVLEKEEKDDYWKNRHNQVKLEIDKMYNIISTLQGKTLNMKLLVKDSITERIEVRRDVLTVKLLDVNNKISDLEIVSIQLIGHIDTLVEELKPIDELIRNTQNIIKYLEKENLTVLKKVKDGFRETLSEEIENKIKEYKILIDEANFEIADNLFRATTGGR